MYVRDFFVDTIIIERKLIGRQEDIDKVDD